MGLHDGFEAALNLTTDSHVKLFKKLVSYQSVDFSKSPDRSPKLQFTISRFFLGIGLGQLRLKLVSPNCQKTDSEISRCTSLIPFSENLENCRLTISNTIHFSKFLVAPGGLNGVTCGNYLSSCTKNRIPDPVVSAWFDSVPSPFEWQYGWPPSASWGESFGVRQAAPNSLAGK